MAANRIASDQITVIEAENRWQWIDFREVWAYRELLLALAQRDVKVRYKQTVLGVVWAVLQPVATMLLFSVVFGVLMAVPSDGVPYPVFVYAALLPWTLFAGSVTTASTSLVTSQQLISKVYFPRIIVPVSSVGVALVDFVMSALVLVAMMIFYGLPVGPGLLALPLLVAALIVTALGVGTLLSALTVTYRDFRYVTTFLVQFWMFATPVLYPASIVPEKWRVLLFLNPMAGLIEGFRAAFFDRPFDVESLTVSAVSSAVILLVGMKYFASTERRFADIV